MILTLYPDCKLRLPIRKGIDYWLDVIHPRIQDRAGNTSISYSVTFSRHCWVVPTTIKFRTISSGISLTARR